MKSIKSFILYGIIVLLCIAAFAGYFVSRNNSLSAVSAPETVSTTEAASASGAASTTEAVSARETESQRDQHVLEIMRKSAQIPSPNPVVGVGRGTDYGKAFNDAVENAGGLKNIVKKGDTVVIKPNLITLAVSDGPVITDYRVIQSIADLANACGAAKVIVAEASPYGYIYEVAGYEQITGVELVDMNKAKEEDCYLLKPEKSLTGKKFYIPKVYMDADVVIGAAKLKTHIDTGVTLSLKLSMGVPPLSFYAASGMGKIKLHNMGLDNVIVDLNKIRKPDFVVIDGIIGGEGEGPINVTPVDSQIMFAGADPVAVDTAAMKFMGLTFVDGPHVELAGKEGLGISDLDRIKVVGADLDAIQRPFRVSYIWAMQHGRTEFNGQAD